MNDKQWVWIYTEIKKLFKKASGKVPNDQTSAEAMKLFEELMKVTEKSRKANSEIDTQLNNIMRYVLNIFHSLEREGREL